jgi:ferredoxin-NADP reductase
MNLLNDEGIKGNATLSDGTVEMAMSKWVEGKVAGVQRWNDSLYSLRVEAAVAPFEAGQFTKLALDIDGETVERP